MSTLTAPGGMSGTESQRTARAGTDLLLRAVTALASLKLTCVLFLLAMVIVFIGSLAQARRDVWQVMDDPTDDTFWSRVSNSMHEDGDLIDSPAPKVYENQVRESAYKGAAVKARFNQGKEPAGQTADVEKIYTCYTRPGFLRSASPNGQVLIKRKETPTEVRRRFQSAQSSAHLSARSFHSAIWASAANHQNVTAYDLAIGSGGAVDDPEFRNYLCAVADWRVAQVATEKIKKDGKGKMPELTWVENPDILAEVAALERSQRGELFCVGFAAESHDLIAQAKAKRD